MAELPDPRKTAETRAAAMEEGDLLAKGLGIRLLEIAPGYARLAMKVRPDMANGAGIGHGGATFSLADTAFAYACNTHAEVALATNCAITFIHGVRIGDSLIAEAREVSLAGRNGVCDVTVKNQDGKVVALFRGLSRQLKDQPGNKT